MPEVAQFVMDVPSARRLTERIRLTAITVRDGVEKLQSLLEEAKEGHVHVALGYQSWPAYIADVMGEEPLRLSRDDRREIVHYLTGEGMSTRAIGQVIGVNNATVKRDRDAGVAFATPSPETDDGVFDPEVDDSEWFADEFEDDEPAPPQTQPSITGLDGKTYKPPAAKTAPRPEPAPAPDRRRPLPDAFFDAVYDLGKKAETLTRLCDDDRFPKNAEKVAAKHRNDLLRTRALIDQVLAQLPQEE